MIPVNYQILWWILLGMMGLSLGSFLNVVIYRLPIDKSIVTPGSMCPGCSTPIKWYDNFPIFSYILLRGRCRHCSARISLRYPFIEFLAGLFTVLLFVRYGLTAQTVIYLILSLAMIAVAFIDLDHMIIPDELSLGGIVVGLGLSFVPGGTDPLNALIGAAAGAGSFALIRWVHMKLTGIEGMGLGDVKLMGAIGAFLGWLSFPVVFLASTVPGIIASTIIFIVQRKGARTPIPFGTLLALGSVVYVFVQPLWLDFLENITLRGF